MVLFNYISLYKKKVYSVEVLGYKNFVGWGADGKAIIAILGHRNATQRTQIREAYHNLFQEDLIKRLESELSGDFEVHKTGTHNFTNVSYEIFLDAFIIMN